MKLKSMLGILLAFVLLSGVSVVFADPWPENGEEVKTTIFYRGQEYLPEELTVEEMKEALGWYMPKTSGGMNALAVPETANPLKTGDKSSFIVENYGKDIADRLDVLRSRIVGDVQGSIKINSWGSNNSSGQVWPFKNVTDVGNYYVGLAKELGLRVKVVTPNTSNPKISNPAANADGNVGSGDVDGIAYIVVEVGPEDATESVMILTHMDTQVDSLRFDHESAIFGHGTDPNATVSKHWNLGGFLSGKEIVDPVTGRTAIVGRGADDDKVTGIPEMYALKVLQDSGVPLKRRVQLLFGSGEEGAGMPGARAYLRLESLPKVSFVADVSDGSLRLTQNVMWYARGVLSWDNPGNDDIRLRFPAILSRDEYAVSNGGISGFARWKSSYDAFHIGSTVGSSQPSGNNNWGFQAKTAAWLVCDNATTAAALYANAITIRNSYITKYWTYLSNQNYYRPFIERPTNIDKGPAGSVNPRLNPDGSPEGGRWDIGIDVKLVRSPGATFDNTVQIIARGITWRYTEQYGQNSRQILMDFLANVAIPSGKTARWSEAMKRIAKVFPYGQTEPGVDTWRAAHLFDTVGVQAYFNELTPYAGTAPANRTTSIPATSWELDVNHNVATPTQPAARTGLPYVGVNTEDIGTLYFELRFLYPMAPYDDDWFKPSTPGSANVNRDYLPTVQAEKVRAAMAAAGIGSTTMTGTNPNVGSSTTVTTNGIASYNQTSGGSGLGNTSAYGIPTYYCSYTHDCVQFGLRSTGAYYKANDSPW